MVEREFVIEAPIQTVFDVVSDLESYPDFLSTTDAVSVRRDGNRVEADFSINVIKEIQYSLLFQLNPPHGLEWTFIKGDLMKDNVGHWKLEEIGETKTKATYGVDVKFGWMVPKKIVDMLTTVQLPEVLKAFKDRAEGKLRL